MRVAIMGTGGLGGMLGGLQARAGHEVSFIARGGTLRALQNRGLRVQLRDEEFRLDVHAVEDPAEIGPVDLVWLCVKTYDLDAAARQILPIVGPETMVITLQNGVEAPDEVGEIVGLEHVVAGINLGGATMTNPGMVSAKARRRQVMLGEPHGGKSARTQRLAE
ncbi:MAG TPA: 2-dehydropantoate 2-reductase N-terminal domain-containing protein, partial [Dehalococcoidia bacterium]|nr:2-dehydropantoate 2-reductase N-terminal domain-containing protein [Dehalococcoidia bacterium]